jgi:hypothetical protein
MADLYHRPRVAFPANSLRRPRVSRALTACVRVDLACGRPCPPGVPSRRRSVHRRTPPRHRHRRGCRSACCGAARRNRVIRRFGAVERPQPHDRDARRLLRDARPPRVDRGEPRRPRRRRADRRLDRPDRNCRAIGSVSPSGDPHDRRSERLPRPTRISPAAPRLGGGRAITRSGRPRRVPSGGSCARPSGARCARPSGTGARKPARAGRCVPACPADDRCDRRTGGRFIGRSFRPRPAAHRAGRDGPPGEPVGRGCRIGRKRSRVDHRPPASRREADQGPSRRQ